MEHHESIKNLYDVLGFVHELQRLEDQFYGLWTKFLLLPFYQSLLNRITEYTDKLFEGNKWTENGKKVFVYLYTAISSKIYSVENNTGNNLIIDLSQYFKLTINEINNWTISVT